MAEQGREFSRTELGQVVLRLQRICFGCPHKRTCGLKSDCPVWVCNRMIGRYLGEPLTVATDEEISSADRAAVPPDAVLDDEHLQIAKDSIRSLCLHCMFHVDHCFLNIVYELLLRSAGKDPKARSVRPGDE